MKYNESINSILFYSNTRSREGNTHLFLQKKTRDHGEERQSQSSDEKILRLIGVFGGTIERGDALRFRLYRLNTL